MKKLLLTAPAFLLILLFVYAVSSKLLDITRYRIEIANQPFPPTVKVVILWLVPLLEFSIVLLLFFIRTRLLGFRMAWCLLFLFIMYTGLILTHAFNRIPCSCGGIISKLSWTQHLYFNLFFLLIATIGLLAELRQRSVNIFHAPGTGETENLQKSR